MDDPPIGGTRQLSQGETPQGLARKGYDKSAQQYLDWSSALPSPRLDWLDKLFNCLGFTVAAEESNVLELGCGAGIPSTLEIAQRCKSVTGVEISSTQLRLANSKFAEAKISRNKFDFKQADMMKVDFPNHSFDAVCAFYSVIHLSLPDQEILFERVHKWLKPKRFFLFNMATQASAEEGEVMDEWLGMTAFWASFGHDRLLEKLRTAGFEIVETDIVHSVHDPPFTWLIARST